MPTRKRTGYPHRSPDNERRAVSPEGCLQPGSQGKAFALRLRLVLLICLSAAFVFSATILIRYYVSGAREEHALKKLTTVAVSPTNTPAASPAQGDAAEPALTPKVPVIMERYRELHRQNPDLAGWIRIAGTKIDYPVMYTGDDFYLSHGFDKKATRSGVPFIDKRCSVRPMGTNTIIYGHHMKNGTMFAGLEKYKSEKYYKEHPVIQLDTLYEQQEYEIVAVFESRIFRKSETVFKHYNFLHAGSEAEFNEYLNGIKALALYDTGIAAFYGDSLLTLVTCAYHTENGQFVVVARKRATSATG